MAGRGMGCAIRGGGAVGSGPKNRMVSEPSMKTGKVLMMRKGGAVKGKNSSAINQHKQMAMGKMGGSPKKMRYGGAC